MQGSVVGIVREQGFDEQPSTSEWLSDGCECGRSYALLDESSGPKGGQDIAREKYREYSIQSG